VWIFGWHYSARFLAYAATHDQLTGLANRTYLWARVAEAAERIGAWPAVLAVSAVTAAASYAAADR
jgi:GGDEF domain-containing protein